jgi:Family of unknown function (DUF6580)
MLAKENCDRGIMFLRGLVVVAFLLFAAIVRILPHPWNFTPIGAMALFGGAKFGKGWPAFLFPLAGLFLGDLFVGFHRLMPIVYLSFCISVLIGMAFRPKQTAGPLSLATLLSAIQFFVITNFGMWAMAIMSIYPKTFAGLLACYVAGIPYFGNTLLGDSFYAALLFGGFALVEHLSPALRDRRYAAV